MEIPTRRVIVKENGLEATINASDFDPILHDTIEPPVAPEGAEPEPEEAAAAEPGGKAVRKGRR
jgi:hypothetical protein